MIRYSPLIAAFAITATAHAQLPPEVLVIRGGALAGLPGETVLAIGRVTTNGTGGWACEVTTTNGAANHDWIYGSATGGPAAILRGFGVPVAGFDQVSTAISAGGDVGWLGLSDQGQIAYECLARVAGSSEPLRKSVWADDSLLALLPINGGSLVGAQMTADGRACWLDGLTKLRVGPQGAVLLDTFQVPGLPTTQTSVPLRMVEVSPSGSHLLVGVAQLGAAYATRLALDGQLATAGGAVIETGQPIPAAAGGLPGEQWFQLDEVAVNDLGDWAFGGLTLNSLGQTRSFVAVNGVIRHRQGDVLDGEVISGLSGVNARLSLDDQGVVMMTARIEPASATSWAIFYDGRRIARAGDAVDLDGDGLADPVAKMSNLATTANRHARVSADRKLYSVAAIDTLGTPNNFADDAVALLRIPLPPIEYGPSKVNSLGLSPRLHFSGAPSLTANNFALEVESLVPSKAGQAFYGLQRGGSPFFGGSLLLSGALTRMPMVVADNIGRVTIPLSIAPTMVGAVRRYQFWQRDPLHPDGTGRGITNALEVSYFP